MSTRSSARNLFPPLDNPKITIRRRSRTDPTLLNNSEMAAEGNGDIPVPDLRTMKELCQPSLNGPGGPIAPIAIQATNFGLKNDMIQQLRNEITNSCQRPNESLFEGWERYKLSINRCPNHNMLPITQIDTFYNGLSLRHRDTINAAAGGTFMKRRPKECHDLIENMTAHHNDWDTSAQRTTAGNTQNVYAVRAYQVVTSIIEPVASPVSAPKPNQRPSIPYPSRLHDQKLCDKANDQREKFFQIFKDLNFNINFADALILMPKFGQTIKTFLTNKDKLSELARTPLNEHCLAVLLKKLPVKLGDHGKFLIPCDFPGMAECLALADLGASINLMPLFSIHKKFLVFSDMIASGNPTPYYDLIISTTSPTLTLFGNNDFLLEEVDAFLALDDDPTSPEVDQSYVDTEGNILVLEAFLSDDPSLPPPNQGNYLPQVQKELKICEAKSNKSSIDEPPEVELKDLPPHIEYAFLEGNNKLPVIIVKDLSVEEKTALIIVLKSRKRAIAWKLSDIKGIDLEFCTHKILMEEDFEPAVQHQRRVNPKIHDVIKNEVLKLINAGLIYSISDSPWLNEATKKDHFPLPFMDQMLERLAGNQYYCFLDGFSGYFQIPINPKDQEKTTFTCPYGTFAYHRKPFGLCNASGMFQRGNKYILVAVDFLSKWVEAKALPTNDARVVCKFLKNLFARFGIPRAIISDRGTHFCNDQFAKVMLKFGVTHRLATPYHPKQVVRWRKVQLNELNELRDQAYENSLIYKEKTKRLYDSKIKDRVFNIDDRVLLFN
nr:reverse transcriptase domain-containing protein [Tanacetum cinerariifolium]